MASKQYIPLGTYNGTSMYGDLNAHLETGLEIEEEKKRTKGLTDFISIKSEEHTAFLERLTLVQEFNYQDAGKIVAEVLEGIKLAEIDKTLKGDFREANLDWAYAKRAFARDFFEHLLGSCASQNAIKFLLTSCRKLQK